MLPDPKDFDSRGHGKWKNPASYIATVYSDCLRSIPTGSFLDRKKALSIHGPTFIHVLAPCPPGWRDRVEKSVEMGGWAAKTGVWVLYEWEYGEPMLSPFSNAARKRLAPLEDYLAPQGQFKGINPRTVEIMRQRISRNLDRLAAEEERA